MGASTIFVIVLVGLFLGAMIAFQVYMHAGKGDDSDREKSTRP